MNTVSLQCSFVIFAVSSFILKISGMGVVVSMNDPLFSKQWYLNESVDNNRTMGIKSAWATGMTGKGVVVSVVDTGIEKTHDEFKSNFDQLASYNFVDNNTDPTPVGGQTGAHGTRAAGIIAANANNSKCGVGIAYEVKIGGIKFVDPTKSALSIGKDFSQQAALTFNRNYIDIYTCAWGPGGKPGASVGYNLSPLQFKESALYGRKGRGNIYVFASGNEGGPFFQDSCTYDGYVTSIYTIAVSALNKDGTFSYKMEKCPSIMAVVYARDNSLPVNKGNPMITADLSNKCYESFSGTSAASAVASGIIALTLQANPKLTWRDVQHIIAETAKPGADIIPDQKMTITNGAGYKVNNRFGFGLMDANRMVKAAKTWKTVSKQTECHFEESKQLVIPSGKLQLKREVNWNQLTACSITKLEHVVLTIDLRFTPRKDLEVEVVSPQNTSSLVIMTRFRDGNVSDSEIKMYPAMTLHNWGESPQGTWTILFRNGKQSAGNGTLRYYKLTLYGTSPQPPPTPPPPSTHRPSTMKKATTPTSKATTYFPQVALLIFCYAAFLHT